MSPILNTRLKKNRWVLLLTLALSLLIWSPAAYAQPSDPAPDRDPNEGGGPYDRLIIRGANVIDGTGAPADGPIDIVIEGNKIVAVKKVGYPSVPIDGERRPDGATREIDASGMYVMPGFVDMHVHTGGKPKVPNAEYVYKLWMGHGVTTVRGVPFSSMEWSLSEKQRSANNEIVAPRMFSYPRIGSGWEDRAVTGPESARQWVRWAQGQGMDGLKLGAHDPWILEAVLADAERLQFNGTAHLAQMGVYRMNTLDAANMVLGAQTHDYGLFESMYDGHDVQPYPIDYNDGDEQDRFGQVARQWNEIVEPGGEEWNKLIDQFLEY